MADDDAPNPVAAAPMNPSASPWWQAWDPNQVLIADTSVPDSWKTCVQQGVYFGDQEFSGNLGGRISSIFVIFITSAIVTLFPVVAKRIKWLRIPQLIYQIAKNFGTGVIVTTAFIHLMDPAYAEIGPQSCVGSTGQWAIYSWCPAIMLASAFLVFLVDTYSDFFARKYFAQQHSHDDTFVNGPHQHDLLQDGHHHGDGHVAPAGTVSHSNQPATEAPSFGEDEEDKKVDGYRADARSVEVVDKDFASQFGGFLILEFGVLFHSVMIGLTLGTSDEYSTLYIVLVFHQAFEGLGIGARLSMIPFPKGKEWWQWPLCIAYALTTPIAIAIGLGVRNAYRDDSYEALVVSGVLDAMSAGILLYTGFVELLARDFIFNSHKTLSFWNLTLQLFVLLWGAGLMALLGKWA